MNDTISNNELNCMFGNNRSSFFDEELEAEIDNKVSDIMHIELYNPINRFLCINFNDLIDDRIEDYFPTH